MSNAGNGCFKRRQPRFDSGAAARMFRGRGGLSFSDASAFQLIAAWCCRPIPSREQSALAQLLEAIKKLGPKQVSLPDRVAAIAYKVGDYDFGEKIVTFSDTPFGDWIRAKLLLHRGNLKEAATAYARAARHFPQENTRTHQLAARLHAEWSVVRLARGEYIAALHQLVHSAPTFGEDIRPSQQDLAYGSAGLSLKIALIVFSA
jgi:tetratricopeptide (TPR) repeat protein